MNKRAKFAGLAVTIGLLGACGGGESATETSTTDAPSETTTPETTPATDPPATDPPTTTVPESDRPDWASGEMVTVESDNGPIQLPVEVAPFCESSRSFYLAANGVNYLDDGQVGTAQQLFAALVALSPATIDTAPSAELAAEPIAARDQLAVIVPAFEEIGYDTNRISELSDPEALIVAAQAFTETTDSLRTFLTQFCGADEDVLDEQSQNVVTIAAEAAGESGEPVEPAEGVPVTNAASTISLSVPTDWSETDESVVSGRDQLVVTPNLAAFSELSAPGVLVVRGEGGLRDGGFTGRALDFQANLEEIGCELIGTDDYNDGIYEGTERVFDCGTDGLDVRVLGGTTADESLYAMVLVVYPSDEPGVRQLIVDTFDVF